MIAASKYQSLKLKSTIRQSSLDSLIPANSSRPHPINWKSWTKRSSNGDGKSSVSLQPSPQQSSPVGISSSSPCLATPSKQPNFVASGAAKIAAHARRPSPTASSKEPSTNRPTIPPTHRQPRHFDPPGPRPATAHYGPTLSPKFTETLNSPFVNPRPAIQQDHQVSSPPAPRWPH